MYSQRVSDTDLTTRVRSTAIDEQKLE